MYSLGQELLGNSKDTLGIIDIDVELNSMSGHFLKFEVSDATEPMHDHEPKRSAFDVMMAAQRQLCLPQLPPRIEKKTLTRKETLHNDLISLLEKHDLAWDGVEATEGCGMQFVKKKTVFELLWYIDGWHHVLQIKGVLYLNLSPISVVKMYLRHQSTESIRVKIYVR